MEAVSPDTEVDPSKVEGDLRLMATGFACILGALYPEWKDDPHLQDTPTRAAKAWYREIFAGLTQKPPKITSFPHRGSSPGMVLLRDIPVRSVCSHHLLPFIGTATVAYISGNETILGLSKLSRISNHYARRPQVQERLTEQIAQTVFDYVCGVGGEGGSAVVIKAAHMCMELRGVNHHGEMVTSHLVGDFIEDAVRAEFLDLAGVK